MPTLVELFADKMAEVGVDVVFGLPGGKTWTYSIPSAFNLRHSSSTAETSKGRNTSPLAVIRSGTPNRKRRAGWRLIGHTSLQPFDPKSETPFLFSPGDEVRFIVEDDCLAP